MKIKINLSFLIKSAVLIIVLMQTSYATFSQEIDKKRIISHLNGTITITNKGISTIPSFTLGKPAIVFDLSMGKDKLSFDPQLKFATTGKPWSFIFWWRYKAFDSEKFKLGIGAHPAFAFKTTPLITNGTTTETISVRRYLATELTPTYSISKNLNVGIYYLYSRCLEKDAARNTNFLALRSNAKINLSDQYSMNLAPQMYYLKSDKNDGIYVSASMSLARRNFPLSLSSLINKTIQSNVPGSQDFLWNVSLIYSFGKKYIQL